MNDSIEKFNHFAGLILADRLSCFPRKDKFSPDSLLGVERFEKTFDQGKYTYLYLKDGAEVNMKEDFEFLSYVIDWLLDHGYLSGSIGRGSFLTFSFTLSPAALVILNSTPKALQQPSGSESYGALLTAAIKDKTISEISSVAYHYISDSITFASGAISSGFEKMLS